LGRVCPKLLGSLDLLQGLGGPKAREALTERFSDLPLLVPDRADHVAAAELRNMCRRHGIAVGTIDALLVRLCIRYDLVMLAADLDVARMVVHTGLRIWAPRSPTTPAQQGR
jgi:hypothetical protein